MSNTHDARGECVGYKWKRANIFPRGPSNLFPAMGEPLVAGDGGFSRRRMGTTAVLNRSLLFRSG